MQDTKYKKFIHFSFILFFLFPCILILLNYMMDPNQRYRLIAEEKTLKNLLSSKDSVLVLPDNYDDRALIKKVIPIAEEVSYVSLGGSRVLNIQSEMFVDPNKNKFLNLGVTSGTIRDYVAIWQQLKQFNLNPEYVFLCIEAQSINSQSQNNLYLSMAEYYEAFFDSSISLRHQLIGITTNLKDLLSFETTKSSISSLTQLEKKKSFLSPRNERDMERSSRTHSFSMLYPQSYEKRPLDKVNSMGRSNGVGESEVFENWNQLDEKGLKHLKALIRDIKDSGSTPILVGMPYHPESYRIIRKNQKAYDNLVSFIGTLRHIADSESVLFYDAIEEYHGDFQDVDFIDGVHLRMQAIHALFLKLDQIHQLDIVNPDFKVLDGEIVK